MLLATGLLPWAALPALAAAPEGAPAAAACAGPPAPPLALRLAAAC